MPTFINQLAKRFFQEQQGTVLTLVALAMTCLLGFTGLVTDGGIVYLTKTKLTNTVDAAALAGVQDLIIDELTAENTAQNYASQNGAASGEVTAVADEFTKEVTVTARRNVNLFFARVLGIESSEVSATATAYLGAITAVSGAAPLSVGRHEFVYGQQYYLKDAPGGTSDPTRGIGWYAPLSLGGSGADQYRENLKSGFSGTLRAGDVGDIVETETGNMSGPTSDGITYRLIQCNHSPQCTFASFQRGCPKVLVVPVVEPYSWSGQQVKKIRILGFAAFFLEEAPGSGNDNQVVGRFIRTITSGTISTSGSGYGLYGVKLIH